MLHRSRFLTSKCDWAHFLSAIDLRLTMRSTLLALALVALASAAPAEEPVRCDVGTYYWGQYFGKAYCVKCPKDTTSAGCVNCAEDKKHARCNCNVKLTSILTCGRSKYM